jgi:hypothetical protein
LLWVHVVAAGLAEEVLPLPLRPQLLPQH